MSLLGAVIVSLALPALWRYDSRDRQGSAADQAEQTAACPVPEPPHSAIG